MHDVLRERLWRHMEALPDEQLYKVLDYIEFLGSKYARDGVRPPSSSLQRFGERLEDKLRGQRLGITAIRGTMSAVGTADRFLSGIAESGRTFLRDVVSTDPDPAQRPTPQQGSELAGPRVPRRQEEAAAEPRLPQPAPEPAPEPGPERSGDRPADG